MSCSAAWQCMSGCRRSVSCLISWDPGHPAWCSHPFLHLLGWRCLMARVLASQIKSVLSCCAPPTGWAHMRTQFRVTMPTQHFNQHTPAQTQPPHSIHSPLHIHGPQPRRNALYHATTHVTTICTRAAPTTAGLERPSVAAGGPAQLPCCPASAPSAAASPADPAQPLSDALLRWSWRMLLP